MFVKEIEEVESFAGESLPRTGFAFFPHDEEIGFLIFSGAIEQELGADSL